MPFHQNFARVATGESHHSRLHVHEAITLFFSRSLLQTTEMYVMQVGGLSVINAIAGAYSENLPVICIVGMHVISGDT